MPNASVTQKIHIAKVADPADAQSTLPFDLLPRQYVKNQLVQTPDGRTATVEKVAVSPYWPEEREGIVRVYVVSELFHLGGVNSWTDWVLPSDLVVLL